MKSYTIGDYISVGCKEMDSIIRAVHEATNGRVCDTGCAVFNDGTCCAYKKLILIGSTGKIPFKQQETVKQQAIRMGISISEVRRRRRHAKI